MDFPGTRPCGSQALVIESPLTLMATALSALLAGPFATEPSATLNALPWHGQLMVPP